MLMAGLSFLAMYASMYIMVDTFSNAYINLDQLYMVIFMVSLMLLIEVIVMSSMYAKKVKITITIISILLLVASFIFVRNQTAISDQEFLKSMITHHSSALLMCKKAPIQDVEIQNLCKTILSGQQLEIDWMKTKLIQ